ncbi:MAG: pitrilysin family protein [Cyanobacteria bacterium P01_D01_bin.123]
MRKTVAWIFGAIAIALFLILGASGSLPIWAGRAKHYTELTFPPLADVQLPEYERFQLENGLVAYLIEDRELPLVSGRMLVRTGDRLEPADKVGLAGMVGSVMRASGTRSHGPEELNQLLEQRAASVETAISTAAGSAGFSALSEDLETVFELFAEVIRQPRFGAPQFELVKTQLRGQIERRNDDPDGIASRELRKAIYGADSPYARTIESDTIAAVSLEDLSAFYRRYFTPERSILGIIGDFDTEQMRSLVETYFGDWHPSPAALDSGDSDPLPSVQQLQSGKIAIADRPQLTQSSVLMGHLGGQLDDNDYAALSVLNSVLNGFGGRLFNEVRSRQGLAYTVFAAWSARYDYPGLFLAGGQTQTETTAQFIRSVRAELERLQSAPISAEELAYAKDSTLNSFVFNFQDPSQTLSRLLRYEYFDYPEDFIFRYRQAVEAVTAADVLRVARDRLKPEDMVTVVVGQANAIESALTELSPDHSIERIELDATVAIR